ENPTVSTKTDSRLPEQRVQDGEDGAVVSSPGKLVGLNHGGAELFRRHPGNPLLTAAMWPYTANAVFNPGATRLPSGETLLLVRVEDRRGISHLTAARSRDGVHDWRIDPQPTFSAQPEQYPEELWGVEDARIVGLDGLNSF